MISYEKCTCHEHGEKGKPCSSHYQGQWPHGNPCEICGFKNLVNKQMKHELVIEKDKEYQGRVCKKCEVLYDLNIKLYGIEENTDICDGKPPEGINIGGIIVG